MIPLALTSNAQDVINQIDKFPARMLDAVRQELDYQNQLTVGVAQRDFLSKRGPTTLGVVTNRLRLSASAFPAEIQGQSVFSSLGSNVRYAGAHEFGFNGTVTVRAHSRRNPNSDVYKTGAKSSIARMDSRGRIVRNNPKPVALGVIQVKAHKMKMNIPARAPFQQAIEAREEKYRVGISRVIVSAWKEGGRP